ncbi:acyltransferase [Pseudomonas sp. MAFF 730085]|uniref:Acyltransferase n=1 Tax=Pseudomonas kitaguniensis TaxID=2607908 RepID=A0A5N7JNP7_9PSED|nr:acyltransferase [Pseudomonas kitaguniensis]MPQ82999.1 acyltransferase [Pseudomonas kitaguniensis]
MPLIRKGICVPQINSIKLTRYPGFDLVRLLLALEVVVAHGWPVIDPTVGWPGFIMAVPAFLAVSGFLLLKSYATSGSWVIFTKKRALRIFPALVTSFVLGFLLFDRTFVEASFIMWISGGLYDFPGLANAPVWSLAWEELAYLCLALLWTVGAYKKPIFIWALLAVSSALSAYVVHSGLSPLTQILSFLAPAFFVGNLTYIYSLILLKLGNILPWLFFIGICWWGTSSPPVLQAFATVWAGMAGRQVLPVRIPDISYGIYIYHMPVLLYLTVVCGVTSAVTLITLMIATLIPLCLASWYLIEKPFLRLK